MLTKQLFAIRNRFGMPVEAEKLALMRKISAAETKSARELKQLHAALCFIRAFPDSTEHHDAARKELARMEHRVDALAAAERDKLRDTGIACTPVHYAFSYEVASWLAGRVPGSVSIDWDDSDDSPALDGILSHLFHPAEDEYFDSGFVSGREWIEQAAAKSKGSDFDWLMTQLREARLTRIWAQLYNETELWLTWQLHAERYSKTLNVFPVSKVLSRRQGMRKPGRGVKKAIQDRIRSLTVLGPAAGARLVDVAMASLAVRHRETYHFNHANPREVYLADVGQGTSIALFGLQNRFRFPLECTMGYLILSQGVPVGYGGASVMFRQVNTGANIFSEYRGSEAAFLWVQVMRAFHQVTGCTRFIANPYQFGAGNDEALRSGAFWFYYRLGYRPVLPKVRQLALREFSKLRHDRNYRSDMAALRRLASCDMHLSLPGARQNEFFDERWIVTSSMLATRILDRAGGHTRDEAANRVADDLAKDVGIENFDEWSAAEQAGLKRIAPIATAARPGTWTSAERRSMRELLRAKGGEREASYARAMNRHKRFLAELRKACRRAVSEE